MKTFKYALVLFLLGYGLVQMTAASVYVYTADDGSVSLSNVPADSRYQVLIAEPKVNALAAPEVTAPKQRRILLANKTQYNRIVADAARTFGLDGALLHAVISVESRYNPKAVSKRGAVGLMQLMPVTALRYGVADSFDPVQNINGGAQYLSDLLKLFNGDVSLAIAAYNAGENAVAKYGNRIPPFRETRHYVPRVLDYYQQYSAI